MDINFLVNISSRAWSLPILSQLHAGVPGRQAALLTATGATRTAFAQSMEHLIRMGLVERNPGYGHPLRPEFRLTQQGSHAAAIAARVLGESTPEDQTLLRRSWTLPVLASLEQPRHFNDIKKILPRITDRALSQSLRSMEDKQWVSRSVNAAARPPRTLYRAVSTGERISRMTAAQIAFGHL